ncbi:MAG TPA: undecaprenyldiphospho-muramoylpentapeptide beta-N-acetylglucosaminyltransferase [Vicinamibacteria bacterium]|nr:undecaprenyldiphospho-muramoylpentapeptide beta-N-acetylglucosaminyltransferase [Vicinamibacteria bacterium]
MARTVLVAAGGTGGHLFPGIAVADELVRRDVSTRVVFAGTAKGLESRLVPRTGHALERLPILPLNGVGVPRMLKGLLVLPWGLVSSALLVLRLRPAAVLGIGGYAGGPVTLLAALLGVRAVILEPNAKPGFTNRVLRPFVHAAACAYEEARQEFGAKGVLTGNPVRGGFASLPRKEHREPLTLLAFGGSQGSRVLNRALVAAMPRLPREERLRIVHQTGEAMRDEVEAAYRAAGRPAEVVAFLDDMETRFAAADLVLSRSGATTCAELTVAGKASVLVPFALAAEGHQLQNARALEAAGAAVVLEEKGLTGESLARTVLGLVDAPGEIAAMEEAARGMGRPDAAARVADLLLKAEATRA